MEKWERSNGMSLMIMKHSIPEAIRGAIPEESRAKTFLDQIVNRFAANEKVETNSILSKLVSMRYKRKENIKEYTMEMFNLVTRLKALKLELSEDILVHLGHGTNKKRKKDNKGKQTAYSGIFEQKVQKKQDKKIVCFFCKKACTKYAAWREKKGPFTKYLMECGIVPQYTMPVLSQNGVAERRNRTLKDMGCPAKARPYKPNEKKLDSRTVSCYFVGYSKRSRGFKLYDPSTRSFFETGNTKFIEDVELSERESLRNVVFEEEFVSSPIIETGHGHIMFDGTIQNVQPITHFVDTPEIPHTQVVEPIQVHEEVTQQPQEPQVQVPLRRSTRERRSTISDDYVVYLQEHEFDMGLEDDPISISLIELLEDVKPIGCKWIFKTKQDSKGNIVRYKARLVAKGFTQKEDIDYKETFSSISSKDSFRIIMALMAHYDLELHQMDVKTAFLNGNIDEIIYMVQLEKFESDDSKQLENIVDQCIYLKCSGSKFIILVLYVDDILLASSDVELFMKPSDLSSKFDMKDLGNASFVLGIQIYRDRSRGDTPMAKGDKFSLKQCPRNELERKDMERYLSNPSMDHWKKAKQVMCRRSTSGYIFMLARGAVSWKSVKQTLIASSTMEAEFIACYETSNHGIWLRNFIIELRIVDRIEKPLRINCDNKVA
ncbi:Retrovirus-related Pol polyprotein from transposon TNT 1-94 [Vitis vinifera]|uniref:Retrovirus-related Pol polyprotein from transposon TNT 1-94 n=1 Tax=Vitis vinifera TaxID=29760 RepID=A0A438FS00_VITVI|nr:Retrovirus-related Pol polyprotein from transposon TNT 1-94 [Vitis vinifera]